MPRQRKKLFHELIMSLQYCGILGIKLYTFVGVQLLPLSLSRLQCHPTIQKDSLYLPFTELSHPFPSGIISFHQILKLNIFIRLIPFSYSYSTYE